MRGDEGGRGGLVLEGVGAPRPTGGVRNGASVLPHDYPFLLVDRVLARDRGVWAAVLKNVGRDDAWCAPDGGWPVVLFVELMAQAAGVAAAREETEAFLVSIDRFRCRVVPQAGDQLLAVARVTRRFGPAVQVRGVVRAGGRRCAAGELVLRLGS